MLPKYHITIGAIATAITYLLFQITPIKATILFLSTFLIDFDHYLLYAINKKNLSLNKARHYFYDYTDKWLRLSVQKRKKYKRHLLIFHGIETWLLLIILANYFPIILFVLMGIAIHILLDYIYSIYYEEPLYAKFSQLYVYQSNKKKIVFDFN